MPVYNVTIPDYSPLIEYNGTWIDTPKTDTDWEQYQNHTYHITSQDGSTASLNFNGSAIYIFGARKPGYGDYSVTLDDGSPFAASSTASTDQFDALLYSATSLDTAKEHHLTIKNVFGSSQESSIDIDYMVITAGDGNEQTTSQITFLNQDDPRIKYSADWVHLSNPNYSNRNALLTFTQDASASVTFVGNAVALYGTLNDDHGLFRVSVDGEFGANMSGFSAQARFQTLLYYNNGLQHGQHTVKLMNISPGGSSALELDTVSFETWSDSPAVTVGDGGTITSVVTATKTSGLRPSTAAATTSGDRHIPTSVIVGATLGAVGGIILFILVLLLCCRRRRVEDRQYDSPQDVFRPTPFLTPSRNARGSRNSGLGSSTAAFLAPAASSSTAASSTPSHSFDIWSTTPNTMSTTQFEVESRTSEPTLEKQTQELVLTASFPVRPPRAAAPPSHPPRDAEVQDLPPPAYRQVFPSHPVSSAVPGP